MDRKALQEEEDFANYTIPAFFIATNKPFTIEYHKNPANRYDIRVKGVGIKDALLELYSNPEVPIFSFIRAQDSIKAAVFELQKLDREKKQ